MNLEYRLDGQSHRPTVVLLHGLFGSMDNLGLVRRALTRDYQVLSIDLPDHGRSPHRDSFSYSHYCHEVWQVIQTVVARPVILLGHSMGGKVAMQMALQRPDDVSALLIADIAPAAYAHHHNAVFSALENVDLATITSRQQAEAAMQAHLPEPGTRQFLLKSLYHGESGWQWRFNLAMLKKDYGQIIENNLASMGQRHYPGPTLFIKGNDSAYILPAHREPITRYFPNAQARIIMHAGHWLHAEKPEQFNRIVSQFIQQQSGES